MVIAEHCVPPHRDRTASMQGFLQMLINAGLARVAVALRARTANVLAVGADPMVAAWSRYREMGKTA